MFSRRSFGQSLCPTERWALLVACALLGFSFQASLVTLLSVGNLGLWMDLPHATPAILA
jgi:hypothetical protein